MRLLAGWLSIACLPLSIACKLRIPVLACFPPTTFLSLLTDINPKIKRKPENSTRGRARGRRIKRSCLVMSGHIWLSPTRRKASIPSHPSSFVLGCAGRAVYILGAVRVRCACAGAQPYQTRLLRLLQHDSQPDLRRHVSQPDYFDMTRADADSRGYRRRQESTRSKDASWPVETRAASVRVRVCYIFRRCLLATAYMHMHIM